MPKVWTIIIAAALGVGCTRPSPDTPGVEDQPPMHPERSPATQPSRPVATAASPADSPEDPDSPGTPRTPPARAVAPMDDESDAGNQATPAEAAR